MDYRKALCDVINDLLEYNKQKASGSTRANELRSYKKLIKKSEKIKKALISEPVSCHIKK